MQLRFGEKNIVSFDDEADFYLCLGFLLNKSKQVRFAWEQYDNKWGIEGRIWIKDSSNAPQSLRRSFSAGTETVENRLNCNEYLLYLHNNFGIRKGNLQDLKSISSWIPKQYLQVFNKGLSL